MPFDFSLWKIQLCKQCARNSRDLSPSLSFFLGWTRKKNEGGEEEEEEDEEEEKEN